MEIIPEDCFSDCQNLKYIELEKCREFLENSFSNCVSLSDLNMSAIEIIKWRPIYKCFTTIKKLDFSSLKEANYDLFESSSYLVEENT